MKLIFAVLFVSLNDEPCTSL